MSSRQLLFRLGLGLCWLSTASTAAATESSQPASQNNEIDPADGESSEREENDSQLADANLDAASEIEQSEAAQSEVIQSAVDHLEEIQLEVNYSEEAQLEAAQLETAQLETAQSIEKNPIDEWISNSEVKQNLVPLSPSSVSPLQEGFEAVSTEQTVTLPQWVIEDTADNKPIEKIAPLSAFNEAFTVFPVGINVGDRPALPTTLIKGSETESTTLNQWLIPFDSVTQALGITVTVLDSGEWELRSPNLVIRISPETLQTDRDLGLVLSIAQIQTLLNVSAQFEQLDYAIRFDAPWLGERYQHTRRSDRPILTEELPLVSPTPLGISGISQTTRIAGQSDRAVDVQSGFSAVGAIAGGSWYARTEQPEVGDLSSWRLSEFQYLRQRETSDLALGAQPVFWPSQNRSSRDYWGATYVQRWGFAPAEDRGRNGFDPQRRLQANAVGRTVSGEAEPGTLVRLSQGIRGSIIDEVLVDSSGIYRFENADSNRGTGRYQVLLYPEGQLTALPEVRTANFSSLPGQLPKGASALILTGGFGRETAAFNRNGDRRGDRWLGDFGDFRGGVAYQRGLTESLTVGAGFVQDESPQVLTEAFYAPNGLPLRLAVSALSDLKTSEVRVNADMQYRPSRDLYMSFNSDRLSQRFSSEWKVRKGLTLLAKGSTRDEALTGGARFLVNKDSFFLFGNATFDTKSRLRWGLNARKGALGIQHFGNENTTHSELFYNLSDSYAYGDGHGLLLSYDTQRANESSNQLGTLSYRYRSKQRANDGRPLWDTQVGYGVGSSGSGIVASMSTALLPGVEIRAQYKGVSVLGDRDSFQIEFRPRLNFQGGLSLANQYQDRLRTNGGLLLQPFLDANENGKRDRGESVIDDNLDLLLSVNYEDLSQYRPDIRREGAFITLPPDMYRVDLDPAGYPLDWRASETAYAVSATAGQYTSVEIPFTRAYTIIGTVMGDDNESLSGQRVEAVEVGSERRQFSVTNAAGVFYLEGLPAGRYRFEIDGNPTSSEPVFLNPTVEGLQEINFHVLLDGITMQQILPETAPTLAEQNAVLM